MSTKNDEAFILDGKKVADMILDRLAEKNTMPLHHKLYVFSVGDDPASASYIRSKEKACKRVKIRFEHCHYSDTTNEELCAAIEKAAMDPFTAGIIVQLPLPKHLDKNLVLSKIPPCLDVDCFHPMNRGMLFDNVGLMPCTPRGIIDLLKAYLIGFERKHVVIIGRSNIVGKPLALALMTSENCTVTVCNSYTYNLSAITRSADIIVCAVGKPGFLTADMVSDDAIVVDVGINRVDGKIVGDVDFENVKHKALWITPVPGGVGRMTVAELMLNMFLMNKELAVMLV